MLEAPSLQNAGGSQDGFHAKDRLVFDGLRLISHSTTRQNGLLKGMAALLANAGDINQGGAALNQHEWPLASFHCSLELVDAFSDTPTT